MRKVVIAAVVLILICALFLVWLFVPGKEQADAELPAIMVSKETGEIEQTAVRIDGQWSQRKISKNSAVFSGTIQVDGLRYTQNEWEQSVDLQVRSDLKCLVGGLSYKTAEGELASAFLYTNQEHTTYIISDVNYFVFAPAEDIEDAYAICEALGLKYPEGIE